MLSPTHSALSTHNSSPEEHNHQQQPPNASNTLWDDELQSVNSKGPVQQYDQADHQQQPLASEIPTDGDSTTQPRPTRMKEIPVEKFTSSTRRYMELIVGHTNTLHKFVISEAHLRQLSQAWDKVIRSRSSIAQRGWVVRKFTHQIKVLRLPEEDPRVVRLILYIAHHQFSMLPKRLDFKVIVRLIRIAQKYDTMHLLQCHLTFEEWLRPYMDKLYEPGYEEWLYIGRYTSYNRAYVQLAQHLKLHCWTGHDGELLVPGSQIPIAGIFPPRTLYHIKASRIELLMSVVSSTYKLLNSMVDTGSCELATPYVCPQCQKCCTGTNYFNFTRHLKILGLFPLIENVSQIRQSVFELVKLLKTTHVAVDRYEFPALHPPCNALFEKHHACYFEIKLVAAIDKILVEHSKRDPVTPKDIAAYMNACLNEEAVPANQKEDQEQLRRLGVVSYR